jgi:hypothetical protein
MKFVCKIILIASVAFLVAPRIPLLAQNPAPAAQTAAPSTGKKAQATSALTPQEIADAKAKGLVWVNTSTKVYHKDGAFYGATKHGKFMTEDDATKAGYRAAKTPGGKKAAATTASGK